MDAQIANDRLSLVATTTGGCVWRFAARTEGREVDLFRRPPPGGRRAALQAGCFPLVPFGNRVRGNGFSFEGRAFALAPNTAADPHALHGDGWLSEWRIADHQACSLRLTLTMREGASPYRYDAVQEFRLSEGVLAMTLAVTNRGEAALPFGLGWHPYFPLTPDTRLTARFSSAWDEDAQYLATAERPVAGRDLDLSAGGPIPRRWINAGFEGWDGRAEIRWPDRGVELALDTDPPLTQGVLFTPGPSAGSAEASDYVCFEPMSHGVDAHHRAERGGLRRLEPGQTLSRCLRLTSRALPATASAA